VTDAAGHATLPATKPAAAGTAALRATSPGLVSAFPVTVLVTAG